MTQQPPESGEPVDDEPDAPDERPSILFEDNAGGEDDGDGVDTDDDDGLDLLDDPDDVDDPEPSYADDHEDDEDFDDIDTVDAEVDRDDEPVYSCLDPAQRQAGFAEAKRALAGSGLVVLPTDTVYGLAANAFDAAGVRRLFRAKGRGRSMPTPVLIGSKDTLRALAANLSSEARDLADAFWPGGLTLICRQQPSLLWDLGDSRGTVALRMPDQRDALDLLVDNGPLAVSSANRSGQPPATTIELAVQMLAHSVDVYLDAGPVTGGVASTIVDTTGERLRVVRSGAVSLEQLRTVVASVEASESD